MKSSVNKKSNKAIFCGAGISYHSGLPIVNILIEKILKTLQVENAEIQNILNSNIPFEYFMETIRNEVNIDKLIDIYGMGKPNATHYYIAELVKRGEVKNIMTTNFDQLIENALLEQEIEFKVFSDEASFNKIEWNSPIVKVIKIHGCFSSKKELAITMKNVARKSRCKGKNAALKNFFNKTINANIVIMGYSCSDLFDISPVLEEIDTAICSSINFLEHSNDLKKNVEHIGLKNDKNPFKKFEGLRYFINTDDYVKEEAKKLENYCYEFFSHKTLWEENVALWLSDAIEENTEGVIKQIPARLFYNIGNFTKSQEYFEQSMLMAQLSNNQIMFYSEMGNLAMTLNCLGNYKQARVLLEESTKACKNLENVNGQLTQLQALGNVCRNLSDFEGAILAYDEAIKLCVKENDISSLCNALGNAASAYNHTSRPDEAIKYLNKGLEIAVAIGDKQSEGSMLCSFGIAYAKKGEMQKAINYIQQSINVTQMLGDRQGECIALHNLSNIYMTFDNYEKSKEIAVLALNIAMELKSLAHISRAQYNIAYSCLNLMNGAEMALNYFSDALQNNLKVYSEPNQESISIIQGMNMAKELLNKK